jgi:hypothetical protein
MKVKELERPVIHSMASETMDVYWGNTEENTERVTIQLSDDTLPSDDLIGGKTHITQFTEVLKII